MLKHQLKKRFFGPMPAYWNHRQWHNKAKRNAILDYNRKHTELTSPFPLYAKIEINGTCNLDCIMCVRTKLPNREKIMTLDQFIYILNQLPELIEWSPHGYNEPMLHPQFFDCVTEAYNRNIQLYLVTNATALNSKNIDRLLKYEPRLIRISIDAVEKEYEKIRQGSNYERVKSNIEYLAQHYDKVQLYATIWKENKDQMPLLQQLADENNIEIRFSEITWKNEYGTSTKENWYEFNVKKTRICTLPWSSMYIDVIGDVFPCTDTLNYQMGNIFETNAKELFNAKSYQNFRKMSIRGSNYECRNCTAWAPHPQFQNEDIPLKLT